MELKDVWNKQVNPEELPDEIHKELTCKKLANEMIEIGKLANRETVCVLTNMNEPLGYAVGNNLEVATTSNNSWANKLAKDNLQLTLGK